MNFNPEIFRAYDIRGVYGRDFDAGFAFQLGRAFVRYLNRKKFLVANDGRDFSQTLAESLIEGITSAGGDVEYIGLSSLPLFYFALNKLGVNGGAMVTASHNSPEYGGFKLFCGDGSQIDSESGLRIVEQLLAEGGEISKYGGRVGENRVAEIKRKYIENVKKKSGVNPADMKGLKVEIRGAGTGAEEARTLLDDFGVLCNEAGFDIAFSFDGDADRLAVFDGGYNRISPNFVLGLLARERIGFFSKPRVVYDLRFSKGVLEKFEEWGIKSFRSRVGRTFIRREMVKHKADLGGELSGHLLFKKNNYSELPLMVTLKILKIMGESGKSITELVEPFKTWFSSGEINIAFSPDFASQNRGSSICDAGRDVKRLAFGGISERLKEKYKDGKIDELDGITVEYNNPADGGASWWFNLRPSNTEPLLRLVVEAKTEGLLNEKIGEITGIIKAAH